MTPIHVVGIGLDGRDGLAASVQQVIEAAAILAGSDRHLSYFPDHPAQRWSLPGLAVALQSHLAQSHPARVVVLTSGDPLFFGLGRYLLQHLPAKALTFHPHVSAIQLAFSRIKLPWQDATLVSAHGRSLDRLEASLKAGASPIAVLTDDVNSPGAIARFIQDLSLPNDYQLWICENLGGTDERIRQLPLAATSSIEVSPLNVVILQRRETSPLPATLPLLGIPDSVFLSFRDRPGLMTKREVRIAILGELALQPGQVIWDIGAGTGSVSIEAARLVPDGQIWAIEKTPVGCELIRQNVTRFGADAVHVVAGRAPAALIDLPAPHRIFIGGSGGLLTPILEQCAPVLRPEGRIVLAIATLEHLAEVNQWLQHQPHWRGQYQQLAVSRSASVGALTRWSPLNPVTLACLTLAEPAPPEDCRRSQHQAEI